MFHTSIKVLYYKKIKILLHTMKWQKNVCDDKDDTTSHHEVAEECL